MTDEHLASGLRAWLKDTEARPDDARRSTDQTMARVVHAEQRGRWWPLPEFRRKGQTATATDTIEYQPSPIPATNGRVPIVIGRTHAMLSPVKAITAGAIVFAIGGVMLIAQPFGQQGGTVPGAPAAAEAAWAAVTGTSGCGPDSAGVEKTDAPPYGLTNRVLRCRDTSTDPRVSGPSTVVINTEGWDSMEGHNAVAWFDYSIEGPDGTWAGHTYGLYDDEGILHLVGILAGDGAYEGLTFTVAGTVSNGSSTLTYNGLIQPGMLPPGFPAATFPEPASE